MSTIKIIEHNNFLVVDTQSEKIKSILRKELTFQAKIYHHPAAHKAAIFELKKKILREFGDAPDQRIPEVKELFKQLNQHKFRVENPMEFQLKECCSLDHKNRLFCQAGFFDRVTNRLTQLGHKLEHVIRGEEKNNPVFKVDFHAFYEMLARFDIKLAPDQEIFIRKIITNRRGLLDLPTGFGKTFCVGIVALLLPRAKIHVVTKRSTILEKEIYASLCGLLPDVGLVTGKTKDFNHRVMCISSGCMKHVAGDADIVFGDECHELMTDNIAPNFTKYHNARCFGLSATHKMRKDGKDYRGEAIFGNFILRREFFHSVAQKQIVNIKVIWKHIQAKKDSAKSSSDPTSRQRRWYWYNTQRNKEIANDARLYDDNTQVLISCDTLAHALKLKVLLPEFVLVYDPATAVTAYQKLTEKGVWPAGLKPITAERRAQYTQDFTRRKLKKAICTPIWNVGVNFNDLEVLIRANGGDSEIADRQLPGRACRTGLTIEKEFGILHDYWDDFGERPLERSKNRFKSYASLRFEQEVPSTIKLPRTRGTKKGEA